MVTYLTDFISSSTDLSNHTAYHIFDSDMEDDEYSATDTPGEFEELSAFEKQRATLQTYIDSVPYECESVEQMQEKLEQIVGKIFICAKAKNWLVLSTWDGMLQW